jgi:DNA-binding MarR family transcriptional regulator
MLPLWRRINHAFIPRSRKWNLPPTAWVTLMHLLHDPRDAEPATLAEAGYVPRQTMTYILDALERDGLAVRRPHAVDRRRKVVVLSSRGRKLAADIQQDLLRFEEIALCAIGQADLAALREHLDRYAQALADANGRDFPA